jgi:hypothetical protein
MVEGLGRHDAEMLEAEREMHMGFVDSENREYDSMW